jgi:uncharacterized membrane protein YoaK (UPF0700 family)
MGGPAGTGSAPPAAASDLDPGARRRDHLLIALTLAAGVADAVSFLGLGEIFTANMTGNVVFLALDLGERNFASALHSGVALAVFSIAALAAGFLLPRARPAATWPPRVTGLLWGEFVCMALFAVLWALLGGAPGPEVVYLLIAVSSFGMGLQNAAARHLAVPGLTTTVVTGSLTNFMIDLPALGVSGTNQRRAGWAILALLAGAAVGATLMVYAREIAPIVTPVVVAVVAGVAYLSFDRPPTGTRATRG